MPRMLIAGAAFAIAGCAPDLSGLSSGGAGDSGAQGGDAGCDVSAAPRSAPCTLTESYGVFVDATKGSDFNGGTRTAPLRTIDKGIDVAKQTGKPRVYACAHGVPYDEHVVLDAAIGLYGSVTCGDAPSPWSPTDDHTVIAPTTPGPVIAVSGATGVVIDGFGLSALDGDATSPDSIVAVVSTSVVAFDHVAMLAGHGASGGPKPETGYNHVTLTPANPATAGGGAVTCVCGDGTSTTGGKGGGTQGQDGAPALGGGQGGVAVYNGQDPTPCNGGDGADGPAGATGKAAPARTLGAAGLSTNAPGGDGQNGGVAQGGGGGAAWQACSGCGIGPGGGGGCGGCGGAGGKGGASGGWSVALVVFSSTIDVSATSLTASDAGDGQSGGDAQGGEKGEAGALGDKPSYPGGHGGAGGDGQPGGAGSGGNGGSSICIAASKDSTLTLDTATKGKLAVGIAGKGGLAGSGGLSPASAGATGLEAKTLSLD